MQTTQPESNSLTAWFQARIQQLYDLQDTNFLAELSSLFEDDATIILNHVPVSLKEFSDQFAALRAAAVSEQVEWKDIQEMAVTDGDEGETAASAAPAEEIVAGCYIVTRSLRFRIRVTPAQSKSHIVFSAKSVAFCLSVLLRADDMYFHLLGCRINLVMTGRLSN